MLFGLEQSTDIFFFLMLAAGILIKLTFVVKKKSE